MDGQFAAGMMRGVASAFNNFVEDRERRNRLNEAYTQRLLSDIDIVGAVSDKNKQVMNDELERVIAESAEDYRRTSHKLFGRQSDTDYTIRLQKRVRELNQRFAGIKANEALFARSNEIYSQDKGKTFDPDMWYRGQQLFMETGIYDPKSLVRKAVPMEDIMKAAHEKPPVPAMPVDKVKGPDGYLEDKITYPGVTDQQKYQALGNLFAADEGVRRGLTREMFNNGDPNEYKDYYQVPPNNPEAWNKYQTELALAGAKKMIPGSGNLTEMELDPQWQQAALMYHMKNTAPKLYQDIVVKRTAPEEGKLTDVQRIELQAKRQAEHDARMAERENKKADVVYNIEDNAELPDNTSGKAISFKPEKRPTISVNTNNLTSLGGPALPSNTYWNFDVSKIANGFAYVEGDNPVMVVDPTTNLAVPDKTQKVKYVGKVPIEDIKSQLKSNSALKWEDVKQVSGPEKAPEKPAQPATPDFARGPKAVAKVRYRTDKGDYEIPLDKVPAFLKKFPKAKKL